MKTLNLKARVADGKLQLGELPCDLPSGMVEVVMVIQPVDGTEPGPPYDMLEGFLAGDFPEDFDVEAELAEIRQEWTSELELE